MRIPLQNVSIMYSDLLPNVNLDLTQLNINLRTMKADVYYSHSIPTSSPLSGEGQIHLEDGVLNMDLPQSFTDLFLSFMTNYIANSYGNTTPTPTEPSTV